MGTVQDERFASLKQKLAITPKTTNLLLIMGYEDYRSLKHVTPNQLLAQFAQRPEVKATSIEGYRRAARRMVWLATQDEPEVMAGKCQDWTMKTLKAKGAWVDDYDDLSGREIEERFGELLKRPDSARPNS